MSSSSDELYKKNSAIEKILKSHCSTPVKNNIRTLSSLTLSTIDTNSSSSKTMSINKLPAAKSYHRKRKKRITTGKKKKRRTKEDSDWETRSEESVFGDLMPENSSSKVVCSDRQFESLSENTRSPEKVRDACYCAKDIVSSPILGNRQSLFLISEKEVPKAQPKILPLEEVPSLNRKSFYDDDSEEDFQVYRKEVPKVYKAPIKEKQSIVKWSKDANWLVQLKVPTTSSDLLWEEFVENNRAEVSQYLAPVSINPNKKSLPVIAEQSTYHSIDLKGRNIQGIDVDWGKGAENKTRKIKRKKYISSPCIEMSIIRGYWDKCSEEFVRVTDEYTHIDTEDTMFERGGKDGKRITLKEFRQRRQLEEVITQDQEIEENRPYRRRTKVAFLEETTKARHSRNSYGDENGSIFEEVSSEDYVEGKSTHCTTSNMTQMSRKMWRRRSNRNDLTDNVDDSWEKSQGYTKHAKSNKNGKSQQANQSSSMNYSVGYIPDKPSIAETRIRFDKWSSVKNHDCSIGADSATHEIRPQKKTFLRRCHDDPSVISFADEEYSNAKRTRFNQPSISLSKERVVGHKSLESTNGNSVRRSQSNTNCTMRAIDCESRALDKITSKTKRDGKEEYNMIASNKEFSFEKRGIPRIVSSVSLSKSDIDKLHKKLKRK